MHISETYTSILWTVKHIQHTCISEVLCFGSHSYLMTVNISSIHVYSEDRTPFTLSWRNGIERRAVGASPACRVVGKIVWLQIRDEAIKGVR